MKNAKDEKVKALYERLKAGVQQVITGGRLQELARFMAKFHKYSFGNTLLILLQKPDASLVAGYKTWEKMGRHVKKGEKGIAIFAPRTYKKEIIDEETGEVTVVITGLAGFKVVHVFDVSQTEGKPLPLLKEPELDDTAAGRDLYGRLLAVANELSVTVRTEQIANGARGYYSPDKNEIALSESLQGDMRTKVLLHELAHALAFRLGEQQRTKKRDDEYIKGEVIAEGATFITAAHFGLDVENTSFDYVAGWAGDAEKVIVWGEAVQKVARELIDRVEKTCAGKKAA
ncbi:MAG: ArdC-like ssDNA-binding domain-containing protein [Desulfitobacteriaceae bacterium]|nr:ArdC-like ssDNA-binding domain-containing protein [Desulfitobacteriaceae bacterium]